MNLHKINELIKEKRKIVKNLPSLDEILRGTFIKVYLKCIRPNCKCHKNKKYHHGPYFRVSFGKGKKVHHIYVPLNWREKAQKWTENYNTIWNGIEDISKINISLMKLSKERQRKNKI